MCLELGVELAVADVQGKLLVDRARVKFSDLPRGQTRMTCIHLSAELLQEGVELSDDDVLLGA